jgi:citrate lyase subunit beta / citryl-CoA lyase
MTSVPVLAGPALLFCPGDRRDRFGKAAAAADAVILDLEDAVAPDNKNRARDEAARALRDLDPARTIVRINAVGTPWHDDDVAALAASPGVTVMLPKARAAADLETLAPRPVIALCETAVGVLAAPAIATAVNCAGLMWGSEDLVADLGGRRGRPPAGGYPPALEEARTRILYAARANGVPPVDTVLADITNTELLRADSTAAANAGFAAKACIHPSQVSVVRAAFRPSPEEIRWALEVTARSVTSPGVFQLAGQMVDAPVIARARETLSQAGRQPGETTPSART